MQKCFPRLISAPIISLPRQFCMDKYLKTGQLEGQHFVLKSFRLLFKR